MRTRIWNVFGLAFMFVMLNGCSSAEVQKTASEVTEITKIVTEGAQANSAAEEQDIEMLEKEVLGAEMQVEEVQNSKQQEEETIELEVSEEASTKAVDVAELEQTKETEVHSFSKTNQNTAIEENEKQELLVAEQSEMAPADSFYAIYSESEMQDALDRGDLVTYFQMLNTNSAVTMMPATEDYADVVVSDVERNSFLSTEFIHYLNAKREEQGLPTYAWSDSMANTALERAEEIVEDFSHNGVRNCAGENLTMVNSSNVADWYENFYASEVHKQNMLDATYHSSAAAVCQIENTNYVVVLFGF